MRKSTLAVALARVAEANSDLESKASAVLGILQQDGIRTEKAFSTAVRDAYAINGWRSTLGRPTKGAAVVAEPLVAAPTTVKQYVSRIRAAFRLKLPVTSYKTFHALKSALRQRALASSKRRPRDGRLAGLRLVKSGELTGAPFHDLMAIFEQAPKTRQKDIAADVEKLVKRYSQAAPKLTLLKAA